jgi:hypothetical protein
MLVEPSRVETAPKQMFVWQKEVTLVVGLVGLAIALLVGGTLWSARRR